MIFLRNETKKFKSFPRDIVAEKYIFSLVRGEAKILSIQKSRTLSHRKGINSGYLVKDNPYSQFNHISFCKYVILSIYEIVH